MNTLDFFCLILVLAVSFSIEPDTVAVENAVGIEKGEPIPVNASFAVVAVVAIDDNAMCVTSAVLKSVLYLLNLF